MRGTEEVNGPSQLKHRHGGAATLRTPTCFDAVDLNVREPLSKLACYIPVVIRKGVAWVTEKLDYGSVDVAITGLGVAHVVSMLHHGGQTTHWKQNRFKGLLALEPFCIASHGKAILLL